MLKYYFKIFNIFYLALLCNISNLIAYNTESDIKYILKNKLNEDIKEIKKLSVGFSNSKIYKINTQQNTYILKQIINYKYSFNDEIQSAKFFEKYLLGPEIYFIDYKKHILLMEYLDSDPIDINLRRSKQLYIYLAKLLKNIHSLPKEEWMSKRNVFDDLNKKIKFIKSKNLDIKTKEAINKIETFLHKSRTQITLNQKVCHNDLNPNNLFLKNNKFKVIDAMVSINDPFNDLCTIAIFWCFNNITEGFLLEEYFARKPTEKELKKYKIIKKIVKLNHALQLLLDCDDKKPILLNFETKQTLFNFLRTTKIKNDKDKIEFASVLYNDVFN